MKRYITNYSDRIFKDKSEAEEFARITGLKELISKLVRPSFIDEFNHLLSYTNLYEPQTKQKVVVKNTYKINKRTKKRVYKKVESLETEIVYVECKVKPMSLLNVNVDFEQLLTQFRNNSVVKEI